MSKNIVVEGMRVRIDERRAFITRRNRKCEAVLDAQFERRGKSLTWDTNGKTLETEVPNVVEPVDEEAETKVVPQDTSSDTQPE